MSRIATAHTCSGSSGSRVRCSPMARRRSGSFSAKRISSSYFAASCRARHDGWYRYCFRPALSMPTAWSFARGPGAIRTSFQAGGIASASRRSTTSGSRMRSPLASKYWNGRRVPLRVHVRRFDIGSVSTRTGAVHNRGAMEANVIVLLEGDETGQELLDEAVRVLQPDVIGLELEFPRYDLSLESRRA